MQKTKPLKVIESAEPFFVPSKLSLSLGPSLSTKLTTVRFQLQDDRLPADYLTNGTVFREIKVSRIRKLRRGNNNQSLKL